MSDKGLKEIASAEVKPFLELLQYQDGSIVSRGLLKTTEAVSPCSHLTTVKD
jgi:hypothetical protein